jgi:hypothetical protein
MADVVEVDPIEGDLGLEEEGDLDLEEEGKETDDAFCEQCGGPVVQVRGQFIVLGYEGRGREMVTLIHHHAPTSLDPKASLVVCRDICVSCGRISTYLDKEDLPTFRAMVDFLEEP